MKKFKALSALLCSHRRSRSLSQEGLAGDIGCSMRTYSKWENGSSAPSIEQIIQISEATRIPAELIGHVALGQQALYDVRSGRYSLCHFDTDFVNRKIIWEELTTSSDMGTTRALTEDLLETALFPRSVGTYAGTTSHKKVGTRRAILAAAGHVPGLNFVVCGDDGLVRGHLITLPISQKRLEALRSSPHLREEDLTVEDIASLDIARLDVTLLITSVFAVSQTYAYILVKNVFYNLLRSVDDGTLNRHAAVCLYPKTHDERELAVKLNFNRIKEGSKEDQDRYQMSFRPAYYATTVGDLYRQICEHYSVDTLAGRG